MLILGVKTPSDGVYEITATEGGRFLLRACYLRVVDAARLAAGEDFLEPEEAADLKCASVSYAAEECAMRLLSRSEQYRRGLFIKLHKRGFPDLCINDALDFLEKEGALSDKRFSDIWLKERARNHTEGRVRLEAELMSRGIARDVARGAVDRFLSEVSEEDLCRKAYAKESAACGDAAKVFQRLMRRGFSSSLIRRTAAEAGGEDALP